MSIRHPVEPVLVTHLIPEVRQELLRDTGQQVYELFTSIDPWSLGGPIDWAGNQPLEQLKARITLTGDTSLGAAFLNTVAFIG